MLPPLVDDLLSLENGVQMYSILHKEYVLVVAPLLLIKADNYRHSELSMHKGSVASHYCTKSMIRQTPNPNPKLRINASAAARTAYYNPERRPQQLSAINHCHPKRTVNELQNLLAETDADLLKVMDLQGFGKNGSELLRLRGYDPTMNTPVELLHSMPLGIGKDLTQVLWKTVLNTTQKVSLQKALTAFRKSPAYARNFRASMNHNGSFVGRDFKQLTQILPAVIRDAFPDIQEGDIVDLAAKCFDAFGRLQSLLYMRNVQGGFESCITLVKHLTLELTDCILKLNNFFIRNNKTPPVIMTLKPKLHMLHHLKQDIRHFGLPIHYETEHGEQFNKFIREEFLRTNRHNPSKAVATGFAKQFIIRHIIDGGSFLVTNTLRDGTEETKRVIGVGRMIGQLKDTQPDFFDIVLNHREYADNNDYSEATQDTLKAGTTSIFISSSPNNTLGQFFGCIDAVEKVNNADKYSISIYEIEQFDSALSSVYFDSHRSALLPSWLTPQDNNIVLKCSRNLQVSSSEIQLKQRLDMCLTFRFKKPANIRRGERRLLNVHKYGSLWTLYQLYNICLL